METQMTHKFELAGLGKAPFRVIRCETRKYIACPGAPVQVGDSCDYCGQGIMECYDIKSADGKVFTVGCDCVYKTGDAGMVNVAKREHNRIVREQKAARDAERIAKGREMLQDATIVARLDVEPHPYAFMAEKGCTRLSWATWMMANAGTKGRIDVCKYLEKISK